MKFSTLFTVAAIASADDWADYKQQFGKVYNGDDEDAKRKAVFNENKKLWGQHASGAILGATVFSDLTAEEFKAQNIRGFQNTKSDLPKVGMHKYNGEELAASVDWTTKGAVTPVKNQGQCGSCWAFSSTGGLEGSWEISTGNLVSMSEQFFVDCSKQNNGCNGGLMDYAFSFAEGVAVATEDSYPYTASDGSCKSSYTTAIPKGGVTGYTDVDQSASALKSALQNSPVSVAIEADQAVFQQYTGGVITSGCGSNLDHGVLAVGYDGSAIKVKNSWGSSWGVDGYVQIDASQCGITQSASVPKTSGSDEWEEYKQQFGKVYNGDDEDSKRKAIFKENKKLWGEHESGAILGATVFSDLTAEEFKAQNIRGWQNTEKSDLPKVGVHKHNGEKLAASVDWTTKGAVTPVKNQGQCGSCWAFSTTGGLEGSWEISTGNLVSMSEQFFVDCSKQNSGCNGGLMDYAFKFAEGVAVATEDSYPYTASDGSCKSSYTTAIPEGGVTGFQDVGQSASDLQSALQKGPVSVAIEADQAVFQQYTGGVIKSGCGTNLDHGVLAVGYDGSAIKVKNSWGSSWGVEGYVQIAADQCGITQSASFPKTSGSSIQV